MLIKVIKIESKKECKSWSLTDVGQVTSQDGLLANFKVLNLEKCAPNVVFMGREDCLGSPMSLIPIFYGDSIITYFTQFLFGKTLPGSLMNNLKWVFKTKFHVLDIWNSGKRCFIQRIIIISFSCHREDHKLERVTTFFSEKNVPFQI